MDKYRVDFFTGMRGAESPTAKLSTALIWSRGMIRQSPTTSTTAIWNGISLRTPATC